MSKTFDWGNLPIEIEVAFTQQEMVDMPGLMAIANRLEEAGVPAGVLMETTLAGCLGKHETPLSVACLSGVLTKTLDMPTGKTIFTWRSK